MDYDQKLTIVYDNGNHYKKAKGIKRYVVKRKVTFQDYKNYLKASQIINIVNYLEKKGINVDNLKEDIFNSERHNVFTVEINKIGWL